ncbi:MAG TPA: hypothetical protein VF713_19000, partial [Thermoanaerobaculia bacterium]
GENSLWTNGRQPEAHVAGTYLAGTARVTITKTTAFAVVQMILAAGLAHAETATSTTATPVARSRPSRDWTVSFALETYLHSVPFPLLGVEVAYHPIDRLAFAARLTTLLIAIDASAEVRFFVVPVQPRSGLYAGLSGHAMMSPLGSGNGGAVELGYEKQFLGGVNVAASAGASFLQIDSCGCGHQVSEQPWASIVNLRMGRSF